MSVKGKGRELDLQKKIDKSKKDIEKVLLLCTRGVTYRYVQVNISLFLSFSLSPSSIFVRTLRLFSLGVASPSPYSCVRAYALALWSMMKRFTIFMRVI